MNVLVKFETNEIYIGNVTNNTIYRRNLQVFSKERFSIKLPKT